MIYFFNRKLMFLNIQSYQNKILINVMADPSNMTFVQTYKKTPLATIVMELKEDELFKDIINERDVVKKHSLIKDFAKSILDSSNEDFNLIIRKFELKLVNQFEHSEKYENILDGFPKDIFYATNLIYFDLTKIRQDDYSKLSDCYNEVIAIMAVPIRGKMRPITRSENYDLLNGCFVKTNAFYDRFNKTSSNEISSDPALEDYKRAYKEDCKWSSYAYSVITRTSFIDRLEEIVKAPYQMISYVCVRLYSTFTIMETDRIDMELGLATIHSLGGYNNLTGKSIHDVVDNYLDEYQYPRYSINRFIIPVFKEEIFKNSKVNLFPINDRPFYAVPQKNEDTVKVPL